jgi:predicted transcriptional regulator
MGLLGLLSPDNGIGQLYVRLHDFGGDEFALYLYFYMRKWNKQNSGDYIHGSCNMAQETIRLDLNWGEKRMKKSLENLTKYGLISSTKRKRKHGGYDQTYYFPQEPLYSVEKFLRKYGDYLRDSERQRLSEVAQKQRGKDDAGVRAHFKLPLP